eukprot:15226775-Alexandrium_andersonii.AAC.1
MRAAALVWLRRACAVAVLLRRGGKIPGTRSRNHARTHASAAQHSQSTIIQPTIALTGTACL